ncbi:MAG: thioredoxin-dependent thiol peroxidase [Ignavibacterium sp.]
MNKIKLFLAFALVFLINCGGNAQNLKEGDIAPDFILQDTFGKNYTLSSYKGKSPVIVYFYPKASTPGCTKQACGIRDKWSQFSEHNIIVLGVSVDSKEDIKKFIDEYNLNFPLLSDNNKEVSKKYGVLSKMGFDNRISFIIDTNGKIYKILRDVDVDSHADEVFDIAMKLNNKDSNK